MRTALLILALSALGCGEEEIPQAGVELYMCADEPCSDRILALTNQATSTLWVAMFTFTHEDIAEGLVAAAGRGVDVSLLVERSQQHGVLPRLQAAGVKIKYDGNGSSMHHKFAVVDGAVTATGSFNWTNNADRHNDENLVILHSKSVAARYVAEFLRVWDLGSDA